MDELKKKECSEVFQKFLDTNQYAKKGILMYEKIFGPTYVSTGGEATTSRFCSSLTYPGLNPGDRILDIGCGIGGSAFFMAKTYGVDVYGVDLSNNMVEIANELRQDQPANVQHRVHFYVDDATTMAYPDNLYDVVYSRDTILHINDKKDLFDKFLKCLKPGGRLVITDYCRGDKATFEDHSKAFKEYVKARGYNLLTVPEYGQEIQKAGFVLVQAQDLTKEFIDILNIELQQFCSKKQEVLQDYEMKDYEYICHGWQDKIKRCLDGDQAWGYFVAKKPFA